VRRVRLACLDERPHRPGRQLEAAVGHRRRVGAKARVKWQRGEQRLRTRGHGHGERLLAPAARLAELAGTALELHLQQLAQAGAVFARGADAAGIGERQLELAGGRAHPPSVRASLLGYGPQVNKKLLGIYLNDHLAGSTVGIELVRRACSQNQGTDYGRFLAELTKEIDEDRAAFIEIMDRLGIRRDPTKVAGGWVLEKMGRLKLNGQLRGYSPLSRLVELEGLALGVTGKLAGWKALRLLADGEPALDAAALEVLIERAERQQRGLEEHRLLATREAFGA
jgi:hypothetical protein